METTASYWLPVADTVQQELLVDIATLCQPSDLAANQVQIRRRELSFYTLVALYELEITSGPAASRSYVLWGPAILQPLDGTEAPIHVLNAELLAVGAFALTAANASEYLAFMLSMCTQHQKIKLLGSLIPLGRDDDQVPPESRLAPLQVLEVSEGVFESRVLVQAGPGYYELALSFGRDGVLQMQSTEVTGSYPPATELEEHRPGKLVVLALATPGHEAYNRAVIVDGRQALRALQARYGSPAPAPEGQAICFSWGDVAPGLHHALVQALNAACQLQLDAARCHSRTLPLPFYDLLDLYEIEAMAPADATAAKPAAARRYCVLWAKPALWRASTHAERTRLGRLLQPLNQTNVPIYQLNKLLARVEGLHLTPDTVPAYVRFFFSYVCGKHGYFNIADSLRLHLREGEADKPLPNLQEYHVQLPALAATGQPGEALQIPLHILFKEHLFFSIALVQPDGTVSLNNERLLGTVLTPVSVLAPYELPELPAGYGSLQARLLLELRLDAQRQVAQAAADRLRAASSTDTSASGAAAPDTIAIPPDASSLDAASPATAGLVPPAGAQPAWRVLPAADFLDELRHDNTRGAALAHTYITGQVTFTEATLRQGVRLHSCYFEERVSCDASTRQTAFRAEQCFFQGGLSFERGWSAPIYLRACKLFPTVSLVAGMDFGATKKSLLTISGLDIAGNIELDSVWITGPADLTETSCGRLTISGCRLEDRLDAQMLRSRGIELASRDADTPFSNWLSDVSFSQARVEGDVKIALLEVQMLTVSNALVAGNLTLAGLSGGAVNGTNVRCDALELSDIATDSSCYWLDFSYLHATRVTVQRVRCLLPPANPDELPTVASSHDLRFEEAVVEGRFYIRELTLAGNLDCTSLRAASFQLEQVQALAFQLQPTSAQPATPALGHLLLSQLTVSSDITISDTRVAGELGMQDLTVEGQLKILGVTVGLDLILRRSHIRRGIRLASWYSDGPTAMQGVEVGGNLNLKRVRAGAVRLSPALVGGTLNASQAQFDSFECWLGLVRQPHNTLDGEFQLRRSCVRGDVRLNNTVVLGNLDWVGADIEGPHGLVARMLQVQGNLRFAIEEVELRKLVVELYREQLWGYDPALYEAAGTAAAQLIRNLPGYRQPAFATQFRTTIKADVELKALRLEGSFGLSETCVEGSVKLKAAVINGSLSLYHTSIRKGLNMSRGIVRHDVIVHYAQVLAHTTPPAPAPTADLTALSVGGLLRFVAAQFDCPLNLTDASLARGLQAALPEAAGPPAARPPYPALRVKGDLILKSAVSQEGIDLTNILLLPFGHNSAPSLLAANLTVEGVLRLADMEAPAQPRTMRIPGCIDLSRARLQELAFSDESHPTNRPTPSPPAPVSARDQVLLDNARIGLLTVQKPPPSPLSLQGLTVQQWNFRPAPAHTDHRQGEQRIRRHYGPMPDNALEYVWFLDQSLDVQKSLYRAVEKQLYDEGNEKASDAVYRVMWMRDHRNQWRDVTRGVGGLWNALSLSLEWLLNNIFGYFTYVPRLTSMALFLWFGLSVIIFSHRANVTAAGPALDAARSRLADTARTPRPSASQRRQQLADSLLLRTDRPPGPWGYRDGLLMALRFHLPFVPITLHEAWVPARRPRLQVLSQRPVDGPPVANSMPAVATLPLSPSSYATLVAWLHWLIIPILGIIISRRILKRAKQA